MPPKARQQKKSDTSSGSEESSSDSGSSQDESSVDANGGTPTPVRKKPSGSVKSGSRAPTSTSLKAGMKRKVEAKSEGQEASGTGACWFVDIIHLIRILNVTAGTKETTPAKKVQKRSSSVSSSKVHKVCESDTTPVGSRATDKDRSTTTPTATQAPAEDIVSFINESPLIHQAYKLVVKSSEGGATEECCEALLEGHYRMLVDISRIHGVKISGLGAMARDMAEVRGRLGLGL